MQPDRNPDSLPCGHCGASTALSWRSDGDGGAMGQGKCSSCGYLVHSFAFNDGLPLDIFLSALLSSFQMPPASSISAHQRRLQNRRAGPSLLDKWT